MRHGYFCLRAKEHSCAFCDWPRPLSSHSVRLREINRDVIERSSFRGLTDQSYLLFGSNRHPVHTKACLCSRSKWITYKRYRTFTIAATTRINKLTSASLFHQVQRGLPSFGTSSLNRNVATRSRNRRPTCVRQRPHHERGVSLVFSIVHRQSQAIAMQIPGS